MVFSEIDIIHYELPKAGSLNLQFPGPPPTYLNTITLSVDKVEGYNLLNEY
jgi:hypothetical protein